jgi:hypothetical protein
VFDNIKNLRPHFHSLREVKEFVSLDIKLPLNWFYEEIVKPYTSIQVQVQDKNDKRTLLSLITNATEGGYDVVFACAHEIVKVNKEEEEKQRLFQEKVKELQLLFKKESLDKLKDISLLEKYGQEDSTSIGDLQQGSGERQDGDTESQESND